MARIIRIERLVRKALEEVPEARNDEFILVQKVYEAIDPRVKQLDFGLVLEIYRRLGLPSFECITRVRCKIQSAEPNLRASDL